jgi:hypothetical protein
MAATIKDVKSASGNTNALALAAFSTNPAAGDTIVVAVACFTLGANTVNAPTDTIGNTYNQVGSTLINGQASISVWRAKNVGAGATTVTFHTSAVLFQAGVGWLLTGMSPNPDNGDVVLLSGSGNPVSAGPTIIAPFKNSIMLAFANIAGGNDIGDPNGWNTEGVNGFTAGMHTAANKKDWATNDDIFSAYKLVTGVDNPTWPNTPGSVNWTTIVVSFAPFKQPTVSSCNPSTVGTVGGDSVTITGDLFEAGATVTFGGTACTNVIVVNPTTITCTAPAKAVGSYDVVVTGTDGNGTLVNGITYAIKPIPTSITPQFVFTPASGSATIKGSGFLNGATVDFGGVAATNVVVVDSQTITCDIPAHVAGSVVVTVTNP